MANCKANHNPLVFKQIHTGELYHIIRYADALSIGNRWERSRQPYLNDYTPIQRHRCCAIAHLKLRLTILTGHFIVNRKVHYI